MGLTAGDTDGKVLLEAFDGKEVIGGSVVGDRAADVEGGGSGCLLPSTW